MKKKLLAFAMVFALAAVAVVGGSLAYFTDTDTKDNTFTTGNVDIELIENFGDNNPDTPEKLLPATGSSQAGTLKNGVTKEVSVKNTGSEDAYVRVHIAIPNVLDNGSDTFDAGKNVLHFNFAKDSIGEGKWDWSKTSGTPYEDDWNYYETSINNVKYNVYVVTYGTALKTGEVTPEKAMHQVYLDSKVTNADVEKINETLDKNWKILVVAEGTQAAGFEDAYSALNTAFGVPGSYNVDWSGAVQQ